MRVIPIPPISMLSMMELWDAQVLLPLSELVSEQQYAREALAAHNRGDYLFLDNGSAEGQPVAWKTILNMAEVYDVSEVVLPDVMGDAEATLQAIKQVSFGRPKQFRYMGVAQGSNGKEVREMIE